MTDNELDQLLNRWRTPAPSPGIRARLRDRFPRRQRRFFMRPLGWAAALALVLCMLAVGTAQSGHGTLENLATDVRRLSDGVTQFFDHMWVAHIMAAFKGSHPKIYIDGELRSDAQFGGAMGAMWLRTPREGKYYLALSLHDFEGPPPPVAGRFNGRVLEFQAGGRAVRIEASHTFGFGLERPVYVMGPRADR